MGFARPGKFATLHTKFRVESASPNGVYAPRNVVEFELVVSEAGLIKMGRYSKSVLQQAVDNLMVAGRGGGATVVDSITGSVTVRGEVEVNPQSMDWLHRLAVITGVEDFALEERKPTKSEPVYTAGPGPSLDIPEGW